MPERKFGAGRYGFNGKERDADLHSLTAYDYGFRIYNPAIGKFLSVDPLMQSYPWNSPYSYAEGDPINFIDLDGLEKWVPKDKIFSGNLYEIFNSPVSESTQDISVGKSLRKIELGKASAAMVAKKSQQLVNILSLRKVSSININTKPQATLNATNTAPWAEAERKKYSEQAQRNANIKNAVMDPWAASVAAGTYVAAQEFVGGIIDHGVGIYEGIQEGDGWKIAKNTVLLGLDVMAFSPLRIPMATRQVEGLWLGGGKSIGLGTDLATIKSLNNLTTKQGWFDVVVHGDDFYVGSAFNIDGITTSVSDLYKIMLQNGYKQGTNIRLISCNGGKGAAQELANLANAQVIAPNALTKVGEAGKLITNDASKYQVFNPKTQ